MDKYRIDSHKLVYHPLRVADWLQGKNTYPIYVEIGPAGQCNCRCVFCSVDYIGYKDRFLRTEMLRERLEEMGKLGVKSIMYAGEGEPFIHPGMADIVLQTKRAGIDAAVTTNGILMKPDISERILGATKWIKVSCNAGDPDTYARIHRTKAAHFQEVLSNLRHAAELKFSKGHHCTLGIQTLLLPENAREIEGLARLARDMGLDYLVVKPYTRHSLNTHDFHFKYDDWARLGESLSAISTDTFKVVFRSRSMSGWDTGIRGYEKCLALPFWAHIDAGGNVWGCGAHLEDDRFLYGNINTRTFQEIWDGEKRRASLHYVDKEFDISECRLNCRMDKVNRYLWELTHPGEHVNFI